MNRSGVQGSRVVIAQRVDYDTLAVNTLYPFTRRYSALQDYSAPVCEGVARDVPQSFFVEWRCGTLRFFRNGPYQYSELPGVFETGSVPCRLAIAWHDGLIGQQLVCDLGAGGAVLLPGTRKVDVAILMPPEQPQPASAATAVVMQSSGTQVATQLPPQPAGTTQSVAVGDVNIAAGYGAVSSWATQRLTDWFYLQPTGVEPPLSPGAVFVPVPAFARTVRWCAIGDGGAASVTARWTFNATAGTSVSNSVMGCEVEPDTDVVVPGGVQGLQFFGDSDVPSRQDVVWGLQL